MGDFDIEVPIMYYFLQINYAHFIVVVGCGGGSVICFTTPPHLTLNRCDHNLTKPVITVISVMCLYFSNNLHLLTEYYK